MTIIKTCIPYRSMDGFRAWLERQHARLHPALFFAQDAVCGMSIFTRDELPTGTCAIEVPASLPITSTASSTAILAAVGIPDDVEQRRARATIQDEVADMRATDWILLHLVLVRLMLDDHLLTLDGNDDAAVAKLAHHAAYIEAIPYPQVALTPLHFTGAELNLLRGTSLHGATIERRRRASAVGPALIAYIEKQAEQQVPSRSATLSTALQALTSKADAKKRLNRLWLWAETAFGSRSFPARIIGQSQSQDNDDASADAVLVPGLDSFNHQRGRPVTWAYEPASAESGHDPGSTKLILDSPTAAGTQVFNNYGAKSTEELLGSYGFVIEDEEARQDDALGLVVSSTLTNEAGSTTAGTRHWWRYGKEQSPPQALIDDIRARLRAADGGQTAQTGADLSELEQIEEDGEVYEALLGMLEAKLERFSQGPSLPPVPLDLDVDGDAGAGAVREEVARMVKIYRNGQEAIMKQAIAWCEAQLEQLEARWAACGGDDSQG